MTRSCLFRVSSSSSKTTTTKRTIEWLRKKKLEDYHSKYVKNKSTYFYRQHIIFTCTSMSNRFSQRESTVLSVCADLLPDVTSDLCGARPREVDVMLRVACCRRLASVVSILSPAYRGVLLLSFLGLEIECLPPRSILMLVLSLTASHILFISRD